MISRRRTLAVGFAAAALTGRHALAGADYPGTLPPRYEPVAPPHPMPDAAMSDLRGGRTALGAMRGHVVLLHFWATWCHICRDETPSVAAAARLLGRDGLRVVALAVDTNLAAVAAHRRRPEFAGLPVYVDPARRLFQALGAIGTPTTLLIDREFRLVGAAEGRVNWASPEAVALLRHYIGSG